MVLDYDFVSGFGFGLCVVGLVCLVIVDYVSSVVWVWYGDCVVGLLRLVICLRWLDVGLCVGFVGSGFSVWVWLDASMIWVYGCLFAVIDCGWWCGCLLLSVAVF